MIRFFKRRSSKSKTNQEDLSILLAEGNQIYNKKDYTAALKIYQKIIAKDSHYLPALMNIAQCEYELKNYDRASEYAQKILTMDLRFKEAHALLGYIAFSQDDFAEAIAHFKTALQLDSADIWLHNYLSQSFQKTGDFLPALEHAWSAVELSNGDDSQQINFAYALYEIASENSSQMVAPYLQKWQQKYGSDSLVNYTCAALQNNSQISKADTAYVQKIFDVFADSFEDSLAALDYHAPQLIADKIRQLQLSPMHIIDLGCGTGLCGKFLDSLPSGRQLCGVDLSAQMLAQANKKNIYNQLINDDIEHYLSMVNQTQDLIIAADVLTYFGDLKNVFSAVFSALDSQGYFIFTLTENKVDSTDYYLHSSGRFLHTQGYVKKLLSECGFMENKFEYVKLRNEGEQPVCGWLISASKT